MTDPQSIRTTRKIVRQELLAHFSDQEIEAEHSRRVLRKFDAWTVIGRRDPHWKSTMQPQGRLPADEPQKKSCKECRKSFTGERAHVYCSTCLPKVVAKIVKTPP
jgi:hypothetical protein